MEIQKNDRIKSLIDHLEQKFGSDTFVIKDFWDSDKEVIGLSNIEESRLVYVSAFDNQTDYFVSLEEGQINSSEYIPAGDHNNVDLEQFYLICSKHLGLDI